MGRYVIVGNGVAGTRAAEVLRRTDADAAITLVTEEAYPFYRRPQLADFAAGQAGEARLWAKPPLFYDEMRLDLRLGAQVTGVDASAHELTLADGSQVGYDKLLVATGRRLQCGLAKGSLPGVNCFKTLDDAKVIRSMDGRGKRAAVYGDGLVALELVRALTSAGFTTTYLVPGERLWPEVLDADAADIAAGRVRAAGAELVFRATVTAIDEVAGRAGGLVLGGGDTLAADVVGVCTDYAPALEFLPDGGKAVVTSASYSTPWDDVFVAGDVTMEPSRHYFNWLRSWRQGAAAGGLMAGATADDAIQDVDVLNMQVLGLSLVALGKTVFPYRSGYTEMRGDYPYGEFYKKLVFDPSGTLVGALLMGNIAEAGVLEEAIRAGKAKAELEPDLLHQMFDVTYRAAYIGAQCPVCRHEIQLARGAHEGDLVTCPICGTEFTLVQGPQGFIARAAR